MGFPMGFPMGFCMEPWGNRERKAPCWCSCRKNLGRFVAEKHLTQSFGKGQYGGTIVEEPCLTGFKFPVVFTLDLGDPYTTFGDKKFALVHSS